MKPGPLDLPIIWRGCDYAPIILRWKDANGNPFDLTGWTPLAKSQSIDFNPVVTDPLAGETQISLLAADTAPLRLGVQNWDWIWMNGATVLPPLLSGKVEVKDPVTSLP